MNPLECMYIVSCKSALWRCTLCRNTLQWRHNERDAVSNHQPHDCLPNRLFRLRSKKTSKLRFTGLCAGNSPVTGEFLAQRASNAENVSIWWRHHESYIKIAHESNRYNCYATPSQIKLVWYLQTQRIYVHNIDYEMISHVSLHSWIYFFIYNWTLPWLT